MGKAIETCADNLGYFNPPNVYRPAILDIRLVGEYDPNDGATNTYRITQNDGKIFDFDVKNGSGGSAGVSIVSVDQVETSYESRGENKIRVTFSDGTTSDFIVRNGGQGGQGDPGIPGPPGIDSVEASIGTNDPTQEPSVDKDLTEGVLSLTFNNIKGAKGDQGEPAVAAENYVTVEATSGTTSATDVLPATGDADTVYRVANWDGTRHDDTAYTEYGWYNGAYKQLATRTPGIDDEPTANSNNLVKSGGVAAQISQLGQEVDENYNLLEIEINKKVGVNDVVDISAIDVEPYLISQTDGNWYGPNNCSHIVFRNIGYEKVIVKTPSDKVCRIAFLKTYNGGNQPYSFADGFSYTNMTVNVGTREITVPTNTNYIYFTISDFGTDRTPQEVKVLVTGGLKDQVDSNTVNIAENTMKIESNDSKYSELLGLVYYKDSYTKKSNGSTYENVKIAEFDISSLVGKGIVFSASPVISTGSLTESQYMLQFYDVSRTYISQLLISKDGGAIFGIVPANAKYIYLYIAISNGTAVTSGVDYTFSGITIYESDSLLGDNKWQGKKVYVIGDSMTAMNPSWFDTVQRIIGFGGYTVRAVGGIGVVQMVDGNPSAGDNYSLTPSLVADCDLIMVNGCYNEQAKIIWNNIGQLTDMYSPEEYNNDVNAGTFYGRMNYLFKRICECLSSSGNNSCKVVLNTPHSFGKNPYRNEDMDIAVNDNFGKAIKAVCQYNCIPVIDVQQKCQINKYNRGYYSASSTVYNTAYIPADGVNDGTNKPFATVSDLPTSGVANNSYATVGTTSSFVTYKYSSGNWNTDSTPFPWNGDQLHVNQKGAKRIGECVAKELMII